MNGPLSFRRYRAAFFFVVALLAAVTAFTLWNELRTNARIDELFGAALEREALIARIRVDAAVLENTVDDHIRATDDDARQLADARMEETLADAKEARLAYTQGLPEGEKELWKRFDETARALAQSARVALRFSNRREAERARQHLEARAPPHRRAAERAGRRAGPQGRSGDAGASPPEGEPADQDHLRRRAGGALGGGARGGRRHLDGPGAPEAGAHHPAAAGRAGPSQPELDAFASRVAHDLVCPLTPAQGLPDAHPPLRVGARTRMRRRCSRDAEASAARMAELVEALLRFCRAGKRSEGPPCELDTAVSAILLEQDQVAALNGVAHRAGARPGRWAWTVPAQLLQSIAQNLISNAVKYSARAAGRAGGGVCRPRG